MAEQLITCLQNEISLLKQLQGLLATEKECLVTRDYPMLESLSNEKQQLSATLEKAANERMTLLGTNPHTGDPKLALQTFLKNCSTEQTSAINELNNELAAQLLQCREQNLVNGQVIAANLHIRRELLNELNTHNPNPKANLYTSAGTIQNQELVDRHQEV